MLKLVCVSQPKAALCEGCCPGLGKQSFLLSQVLVRRLALDETWVRIVKLGGCGDMLSFASGSQVPHLSGPPTHRLLECFLEEVGSSPAPAVPSGQVLRGA